MLLEEEGETKSVEEVRQAQRATWLGTKTRPDLMYTWSRMSQATLRNPKEVVKAGRQVRKYLKKTIQEGIWIKPNPGTTLEVFSDFSYGPGGADSQGAIVVMWGRSIMMWKAGRQANPSLSTAESELIDAIEGMVMGDSVDVLIQELNHDHYTRILKVDNQAAVNLTNEPSGSWRTRHLRLRAAHMRWRTNRMDWLAVAIPGTDQTADVGAKPMSAPELEEMKGMMSMGKRPPRIEEKGGGISEEEATKILRAVMAMAMVAQAKANDGRAVFGWDFVMVILLAGVGCLTVVYGLWWMICQKMKTRKAMMKKEEEEEAEEVESEEEKEPKKRKQAQRSDPGYITEWGTRWHDTPQCPTLKKSVLVKSEWCAACAKKKRHGDTVVYATGPGRTLHYHERCPKMDPQERKKFHKCQRCQELFSKTA